MKYVMEIKDTPSVAQAKPWACAGTDVADQARTYLSRAAWFQAKFLETVGPLVDDVNNAEDIMDLVGMYELNPDQYPLPLRSNLMLDPDNPDLLVNAKIGPPKELERAITKMQSGKSLKDLNRITYEVEDPYVMGILFGCLKSRFNVVGVKNKFVLVPGQTTYTEPPVLHMNIDMDGWIVEVQMHFRDMLVVKAEQHQAYKVRRATSPIEIMAPIIVHKITAADTNAAKERIMSSPSIKGLRGSSAFAEGGSFKVSVQASPSPLAPRICSLCA